MTGYHRRVIGIQTASDVTTGNEPKQQDMETARPDRPVVQVSRTNSPTTLRGIQ